jgi:hypothetical protein
MMFSSRCPLNLSAMSLNAVDIACTSRADAAKSVGTSLETYDSLVGNPRGLFGVDRIIDVISATGPCGTLGAAGVIGLVGAGREV